MQLRTIQDFLVDVALTPAAVVQRRARKQPPAVKIGYIGWVGHGNLGDQAMFQAMATALAPHQLLPMLPAPGERVLRAMGAGGGECFGAVVLGGGTLINRLYLDVAKLAVSWNLPLFVAGTGVGIPGFGFSSRDEGSLQEWAAILHRSPQIAVRGPESAKLLEGAGVSGVEIIGDPALAFTPDVLPVLRGKPRLAVNLGPDGQARNEGVARVVSEFLRTGGEVVGVALGTGDQACLHRFRRLHGLAGMTIESHRDSAEQLLATLEGSHALITVRLHAAVLATCVGVPPVLFAYNSKCLDFMASMDLPACAVPPSTASDYARLREVLCSIESQPALRKTIHRRALAWAEKQKAFFARLLHKIAIAST